MAPARALWARLGQSAAAGRSAWVRNRPISGLERALWIAATVLLAIPIFALLLLAVLAAAALTLAAFVAAWVWVLLAKVRLVGGRDAAGRENVRVVVRRDDAA